MLAVLVTLMFYQVGFAQYHMVLFVLASYWMMSARGAIREAIPLWVALGCYFAEYLYRLERILIKPVEAG